MLTATQSASFLGGGVKLPAAAGSPRCPGAPTRLGVRCAKDVLGKVVSTANDKTAVVEVRRNFAHKLYGKRITTSKKYHAHDEENEAQLGDVVYLELCQPVSKLKKWRIAGYKEKACERFNTCDVENA
mmetsp:Transcript_4667/g.16725  ORF Transcript_4667/g.16725 Transcript_4667/m.16725 type:complete len:128 (-) Transcript_4667:1449-1832(-)